MIYSSSRIQTWERCGAMFEKKYILHLKPEVTSANLVFGKAVHKVWADWVLAWHEGDDFDMPTAFEEEWHRRTTGEAIEYTSRMKEEDLLALGREFGKLFPEAWVRTGLLLAVDRAGKPLVERHLMVRAGGITLQGHLDLVVVDQEGRLGIPDVKTPAQASTLEYAMKADQLTLYQILVEGNEESLGLGGVVDHLGFFEGIKRKVGGRKGPEVHLPLWVPPRTEKVKQAYLNKVSWIAQQVRGGYFPERSLGAFESPCNLCDYRGLCINGSMEGLVVDDRRRKHDEDLEKAVA